MCAFVHEFHEEVTSAARKLALDMFATFFVENPATHKDDIAWERTGQLFFIGHTDLPEDKVYESIKNKATTVHQQLCHAAILLPGHIHTKISLRRRIVID